MAKSSRHSRQPARYGETTRIGDVDVRLFPAGHVIGSAQVEVKWKGLTMVCTGDYKRRADPTCRLFEVVPCNIFISEATFALPVFRHPESPQRSPQAARLRSAPSPTARIWSASTHSARRSA